MNKRSNNIPPRAKKDSNKDTVDTVVEPVVVPAPTPQIVKPIQPTAPEHSTIVSLDGTYKGSDLHNKLQGLAMFLNDETEYIIKIEVKQ